MLTLLLVIGIILFILWILGFSVGFLAGPILWIILVVAIILVIIWLVQRVSETLVPASERNQVNWVIRLGGRVRPNAIARKVVITGSNPVPAFHRCNSIRCEQGEIIMNRRHPQ